MRPDPSVAEVEAYLHRHIPLSADMGVSVVACDAQGATLRAPLEPNINHRATVFGGSASAVAILSAWTWLHFALRAAGQEPRLVIQRNSVEYLAPITAVFEARCEALPCEMLGRFIRTLERHGKARAVMPAELRCAGKIVATFSGEFVAMKVPAREIT
ncbi:MAG: thioesterase protein [Verrucomicrobia bacterium]|nr:thioesterase protein [Verrucomicrobiota bacterium]